MTPSIAGDGSRAYVAVLRRDPDADRWLVHIEGVVRCRSHGRTLRQAQARILDVLSARVGQEPSTLEIAADYPPEVAAIAVRTSRARAEADRAQQEAARTTAEAVRRLTEVGLSRRDTGDLLGISHQRVQQLLGG